MIDITIIVVTWNNEKQITPCIDSIIKNTMLSVTLKLELICIDNNSSDNTFDMLKKITYDRLQVIKNETNLGYTKAVNQGIKYSHGKYIFLLNPDTNLNINCIEIMYHFLDEHDNYGACAPLLINQDGTIQHSLRNFPDYKTMFFELTFLSRIFPRSKLFGRWKMEYFKYDEDADVNQPMAAALMIKRTVLDKFNNLDERYDMFFNDVYICKRMIDNGYKIRFLKNAKAVHLKGSSVYKDRVRMIKVWNRDCLEYFNKFHPNRLLHLWLKINLKISEFFRILYYEFTKYEV